MNSTEERLKQADHTINELNRALRNAAVWGGMDWHYNPLHPMYVRKCLDLIKAYHTDKIQTSKMNCKCTFREYMVGDGCDECNPKKALSYAYETIEDQRSEIDRLESQLNNITCIVAEVRSHWGEIDKFAGKHGPMDCLDEIAEALKAKESK